MADHWAMGGEGAADVARAVVKIIDAGKSKLKLLYPDDMPLLEKIRTIAKEIYRAKDIDVPTSRCATSSPSSRSMGYGKLPICIAKTQYQLHDQRRPQGRADRSHHQRARGAALRRRRVRGGDLRGDHDHARPAARAGRRLDRRRRRTARSSGCSDRSPSCRALVRLASSLLALRDPATRAPRSASQCWVSRRRSTQPTITSYGNRCLIVNNSAHGSSFSTSSLWRRLSTRK